MSMQPKPLNKFIIKASFAKAAEACVRLKGFGSIRGNLNTDEGNFFGKVANELAHNDLIDLAIACRRIAEAAKAKSLARKQKIKDHIPLQLSPSRWEMRAHGNKIELLDLFDRVIHSSHFEIISTDFQIKVLMRKVPKDFADSYYEHRYEHEFNPYFTVCTDQKPFVICEIGEVVVKTITFLDLITDQLSDQNIWIGNHSYDPE